MKYSLVLVYDADALRECHIDTFGFSSLKEAISLFSSMIHQDYVVKAYVYKMEWLRCRPVAVYNGDLL